MLQVKKSNKPIREITAIYLCVVTLCLIFSISGMDLGGQVKPKKKLRAENYLPRLKRGHTHKYYSFLGLAFTQHSQKRSSGFETFNRAYLGYFSRCLCYAVLTRHNTGAEQLWTVTTKVFLGPSLVPSRPWRFWTWRHLSSLSEGCLGPTSVVFIACKDIFCVTSHADKLSTIRFADLCWTYWVHVQGSEMVHPVYPSQA